MFAYEAHNFRGAMLADHPFFDEFPFLRKSFTKQLIYWANRPLLTENNVSSPVDFTLDFLTTEHAEFENALIKPQYNCHAEDEAADVGIVAFIGLAFWSSEQWKANGNLVIGHVSTVLKLSKLTEVQYASYITSVIQGKNNDNYVGSAYAGVRNPSVATAVYKYTAAKLKEVRKQNFGGRFTADANVVFRHRHNDGLSKNVKNDPRYAELLKVANQIDNYRERVGAAPIPL